MTNHQPTQLAPSPVGATGRPGASLRASQAAGPAAHYHRSGPWNDETIAELKRLYDRTGYDKLSMADIAAELWKRWRIDVSKNAVVGAVHRLGLPKRGRQPSGFHTDQRRPRAPRVRKRKPAPIRVAPTPAPIVVEALAPGQAGRVGTFTLFELTGRMCHAPARKCLDIRYFGPPFYCGAACKPIEEMGVGPYCRDCEAWIYQGRTPNVWWASKVGRQ